MGFEKSPHKTAGFVGAPGNPIDRLSAARFKFHRRKTKKNSIRSDAVLLVAGVGFEPHDLRVMRRSVKPEDAETMDFNPGVRHPTRCPPVDGGVKTVFARLTSHPANICMVHGIAAILGVDKSTECFYVGYG